MRCDLPLALTIALLPACAVAGLGPENVAVVVNADSWASRTVANAFVAAHHVPLTNVIYLEDVPGYEHVGVDEFREKLLKPVLKTIEERGLKPHIDCVAWSSDFPYAVDVQSDVAAAGLKLPQVLTPTASINGLTYLYELVLAKDPRYLELNSNWYYRRPFRAGQKPDDAQASKPITNDELTKFREAMKFVQDKKWAEATPLLGELAKGRPHDAQLQYNLSCALAQEGKPDDAMKALAAAVEAGWSDRAHTEKDEDLKPLREREDYKALLPKIVVPSFDVPPPTGFRSDHRWNEKGERVDEGGRRYLLSLMLGVTSGRGTSLEVATRNFDWDRDGNIIGKDGLSGSFYFMKNGDVRSRTREWAFASAVEQLRKLGHKAEIVEGTIPEGALDVAGAVIGIADFDWQKSESQIVTGAIVEHLTSFGGVLKEHSGQTPLTAFLKHGAGGSSGTVTEPYAIQAKFPTAFIQVHYARGATLAEAFYESVQGPYQLLIVGDPLRQPYKRSSFFELKGLEPYATLTAKTAITPKSVEGPPPVHYDFFVDGKPIGQCAHGKSFELDPGLFSLGFHRLTVQARTGDPAEFSTSLSLPSSTWLLGFFVGPAERRIRMKVSGTHPSDVPGVISPLIGHRRSLQVRVECAEATSITIRMQGQPVAEIAGSGGAVGLPVRDVGGEHIQLDAVAETPLGSIASEKFRFEVIVEEPDVVADRTLSDAPLAEGMTLRVEGKDPVTVQDTRDVNWLASLNLPAGTRFTLEGVVEVPSSKEWVEDRGQFQTTGNCHEEIRVKNVRLRPVRQSLWRYYPVVLSTGRHLVTIRGRIPEEAGARPQFIIRYGTEGTLSLDGKRFRHVTSPADKPAE